MNELIQRFNSKVETAVNDEDNQQSYQEIDTADLNYKFIALNDYIEDYSQ